ncbi:gap [Plasmodium gonderi]|uniref:Gap n=1 Tax=Plasmodium gonderi TaxID=77519 RepID=A0A1Y1JL18_PLAGO|nr:gap [Plasmodium gonderi]GAW83229.1 gap [Plasmodium gonderi]
MKNSRKYNYKRTFLFATLSIIFLCADNPFFKSCTSVVNKGYQESCKTMKSLERTLADGEVQGVLHTRDELINLRRRSIYSKMDKLMDCLFRGFLDTLIWVTDEFYKSNVNEVVKDDTMSGKIIRKQMYTEGITLSNRTVSNEALRTKERHNEIIEQGVSYEVIKRMMKLYELENNVSKLMMKRVTDPNKTESIDNILSVEKIKNKIKKKLETTAYKYDEALLDSLSYRIIERIKDIYTDENII